MSIDALRSALGMERPEGLTPKHKAVLVALADHANAAGEAFLSRAAIEAETWYDRKAVSSALADLKDAGLIVDTGKRRGRTGQVVVWHLPWIDHRHKQARKGAASDFHDYEENSRSAVAQQPRALQAVRAGAGARLNRKGAESGPVSERGPNPDSKRPQFGGKEAPIRATEPPTGFNPPTGEVTPLHGAGVREPAPPSPAQAKQPKPKPAGSKAKGHRLPDDWEPSTDLLAWARKKFPEVDLANETEKFFDHWQAAAGATARKADWDATWRNWIRRAPIFGRQAGSGGRPADSRGASSRILE